MGTLQFPAEAQTPLRTYSRPSIEAESVAAWLLGFALTVYLALTGGGGYDIVARSEVAILVWWIVLLCAIGGILPRGRWRPHAWIAVALLGAFFAWTWIATGWSQSEEQTFAEAARVASYLGVLVLGLCVMTRRGASSILCGLASAITLVSALAVLSRLIPSWFPADTTANLYATTRLRYPFDYSDGVGEFAALGLPLLLFVATGARSLWGRALGAAGLPVVVLCLAMTVSRGGILAAAIGLVFFFALASDRLPKLGTALAVAVVSAAEVAALIARAGLRDTLVGSAPAGQRHSMLVITIGAALVAGLIQVALDRLARRRSPPKWLRFSRRGALGAGCLLLTAVIAVVVTLVAIGTAHHLWNQFKQPNPPAAGNSYFRLLSLAGSHRYQYWQVAIAAFKSDPLKGIGPGTFQFYWAQHQTLGESVINAHSLWIETLAEAGIIGAALIVAFFLFTLVAGVSRALRLGLPAEIRMPVATAVSGVAAFCAAAAFDWVWQIGVIPLVAMLLVAVALGPVDDREHGSSVRVHRFGGTRVALALGALAALWAIIVPLASTVALRSSQSDTRTGRFAAALADTATAQRIEPGAASPRLQRALILEQLNDIGGASAAIVQAQLREPTNWRIWLIASRIATEAGNPRLALADYRRARTLNPTSPIFHH